MKTEGFSPVAIRNTILQMDFPGAMRAMLDDGRVTRAEWDDPDAYGALRDGWLQIHLSDGWHAWQVSAGDMRADDWIVVDG